MHKDLSSPGYVSVSQPKLLAFCCDNSNTTLPTTSVTWSSCLGLNAEIPPTVRSLAGDNVILRSPSMGSSHNNCTPHKPNSAAPFNHSQPSYVHLTQWAPAIRSTSTPYIGGPSRNSRHSLQVEEPVDAFIDKQREGQETAFELTFTNLQTESSVALQQVQEQHDYHHLSFSNSQENLLSGPNSMRDFVIRFTTRQPSLTQIEWLIYSKLLRGKQRKQRRGCGRS